MRTRTLTLDRVLAPIVGIGIPAGFLLSMAGLSEEESASLWTFLPMAVAVLLVGGAVVLSRRGSKRGALAEWEAPPPISPGTPRPRSGRVATSLAAVEARELFLSPWFSLGAGFCVLLSLAATAFESSWWTSAMVFTLLAHPLCGFTIVAVHRSVTRDRRDRTADLVASCPAGERDRLLGHLLAGVVPVAVGVVFIVTLLLGSAALLDIYGPLDDRVLSEAFLAAAVLPAGAVSLGVLLGRRAPFALAPMIALGGILLVDVVLWNELDGSGWLASGFPSVPLDAVYLEPPNTARLVWFIGLTMVVAGLALTRTRWTQAGVAGGAALAVVAVALAAPGPSGASAERLAGYVLSAPEYTACVELSDRIHLCAPEPYADHAGRLADVLGPMAAAIPPAAVVDPIALGFEVGDLEGLQREVRRLVRGEHARSFDVDLPLEHHQIHQDQARFEFAAFAAGVPRSPFVPHPLLLDGQARGVVMLWLATAGLSADDALALLEASPHAPSGPRDVVWPSYCSAEVQWSPQDLDAARALVRTDASHTAGVIADDWDHWTDPATTTDELLVALGLDPLGPPDQLEPVGDWC